MKKIKFKFDPINTRGEFYARDPYTDKVLKIVYPSASGNFVTFDFKDKKYRYLDKVEIWYFDPYLGEKRITTIFNQNYKKWQK